MAIETKEKTIGAYSYAVTQLGALQGRGVYTRLAKILGPALAVASKGDWAVALSEVVSNLSEADTEFFTDAFRMKTVATALDGSRTLVLSRPETFDAHFAGNYEDFTYWLVFCLEVNFSGFFDKARGLLGKD